MFANLKLKFLLLIVLISLLFLFPLPAQAAGPGAPPAQVGGVSPAETFAALVGVLLSLASSYIPGWADWYATKTPTDKRLLMLTALLAVSVGIFTGNCLGYGSEIGIVYTCDVAGGMQLFRVFIAALIANQATYTVSPKRLPAKTIDYEE